MRIKLNFQGVSILSIIFIILLFSCKQEKKQVYLSEKNQVLEKDSLEINTLCEEIDVEYRKRDYIEFRVFKLFGENINIEMVLLGKQEKSFLKINDNFYQTHFNYTYETDEETSISEIKVFNCDNNVQTILLPLATEELLIYQILEIKNNVIKKNLGMLSYQTVNFDNLFKANTLNKLEHTKDGYLFKITNKDSKEELVVYDKISPLEEFKNIEKVFPNVETYLNIRFAPSVENSEVISKVFPNEKLTVLSDIGEWSIVYFKGVYGYVNNDFID